MSLTDALFFDTDCLSAFLWVNDQSLLAQLYPGRIVLPAQVYEELSNPSVPMLKERVDRLLEQHEARIERIQVGSTLEKLYIKLVSKPDPGHKIIGKGEAAAIALAKEKGGILASNNFKDILVYVEEFDIPLKTTGDILKEAFGRGLITESEGNRVWKDMLQKRRRLGYPSFSDFLLEQKPNRPTMDFKQL